VIRVYSKLLQERSGTATWWWYSLM
jgi:hypothetical protein